MIKNPPQHLKRFTPYLFYKDVARAMAWLESRFGLENRLEIPNEDGTILHAEMKFYDGVIMMAHPVPENKSTSPSEMEGRHNQSLYVYVDDVDAHFQRVSATDAKIILEPTEKFWGDKMFTALDLDGHVWHFAQHVREADESNLTPS